jgi:hypothetical protein
MLPRTIAELEAKLRTRCAPAKPDPACPDAKAKGAKTLSAAVVGTAPWRTAQLYQAARKALTPPQKKSALTSAAVDSALLSMGLMSHFAGDLAQPYHVTRDYDGWDKNEGGIHAYFESDVVDAFSLSLEQEVFDFASKGKNLLRVLSRIPADVRGKLATDPLALAFALALDSQSRLEELGALDRSAAVTKPSRTDKGSKIKAERRPARDTAAAFHAIVVERLATAAEVVVQLWLAAWQDGGNADLTSYHSFAYPVAPAFVPPDYLDASAR